MSRAFKKAINSAVSNQILTGALTRFSEAYRQSRARAYAGLDFEAMRAEIAGSKGHAASHLEEMVAEFTANATAKGAKVFHARSPEAVRDYILGLAREQGVRAIVKAKSMATEEIHLNMAYRYADAFLDRVAPTAILIERKQEEVQS